MMSAALELETVGWSRHALAKRIAAHPFLIGLNDQQTRLLADCAMETDFRSDQYIFRAGESANRFYLINTGSVVLEAQDGDEAPMIVDTVGPGGLLGWSWLFPPHLWHFDARALEPTTAIFFNGTILRQHLDKDPALGLKLFKRMSDVMIRRLQRARNCLIREMRHRKGK